jgi:hypothetical protein
LDTVDRLARTLGWLSIGLGMVQLMAPGGLARTLGMPGRHALIRAYGGREVGAGILSLSVDKSAGLWSRVAGDMLDLGTLAVIMGRGNPRRHNVKRAFAVVAGIALLDYIAANAVMSRHGRATTGTRRYADRSGFPRGIEAARQSAVGSPPG